MLDSNKWHWGIALLLLIALCGCATEGHRQRQAAFREWITPNGKLKVVSTTEMVHDLVKQVGGEHVDAIALIQGDLNPHSYQLVKGDDEKLAFAQVVFSSGLGLEHGPSLHYYLENSDKVVALGDLLEAKYPSLILQVGGQRDPHIWMDISLWKQIIPFIVEALERHDPAHAAVYQQNGMHLMEEMEKVHREVYALLHRVPAEKRYLVTSHDAFNYFTRAYLSEEGEVASHAWQDRFNAPEGLAPDSQLSVTDIKATIDHLKAHDIHVIFPESNVSRDSIKKIVHAGNEQGLRIRIACCPLYGDAMGAPGSDGDSYLKMILHNARILSSQLNGDHDDE